jgi:hypothetical protein
MKPFAIPPELRAFMREVTTKVDWVDDKSTLVGPEALVHECGRGGRIEGGDRYRFMYFASDGRGRWELELSEQQIRDIAAGVLGEVNALELDPSTRTMRGDPLLVWGEYDEDALRVRSPHDLAVALDSLYAIGGVEPCMIRLWSPADEQIVCVLNGMDIALYVVSGEHGYGTSIGDPTRTGAFELIDHDAGSVSIPWSHCIPWRLVRPALLRFSVHGEVGEEVLLDGAIPVGLLMLGDFDRATELATRRPPVADPAQSSLPGKVPHGEWASRLLGSLVELGLLELDSSILETITARTTMMLVEMGDAAIDSIEVATRLAKDLSKLRGIGALLATPGDLQIALRRTQYAPTSPVELPTFGK